MHARINKLCLYTHTHTYTHTHLIILFCFNSGDKAQEKNQMAVLRMFANLFATKHGEELMIKNFEWVCGEVNGKHIILCCMYILCT